MGWNASEPAAPSRSKQLCGSTNNPAKPDPTSGTARTTPWGGDPGVALAVKCDNPPVVWGTCSLCNTLNDITISVRFLIDTRADVTVIPEKNWPQHWKLENAPMVDRVGGLTRARKSAQLVAITLHTELTPEQMLQSFPKNLAPALEIGECPHSGQSWRTNPGSKERSISSDHASHRKRTRENHHLLPICHAWSPTPVGKGRSSCFESQGDKLTSTSAVALMLEEALSSREGTISVIHVNSHNPVKGFFQTGNDKADAAAKGLWTLRDARQLHESLHIGAKALAKKCAISVTDAKHIVATCPHCQKAPLWSSGVNPRGLKASEVWQTDFTLCQLLKPRAWLAVTVDTYSGVIVDTQHLKTDSKATIQHWLTVMAWLGIPSQIKTDNGPNFVSKSVQAFALKWGITLIHGIPYNSTGQAIVERANQTLKTKLEVLAKTEGFVNAIPSGDQTRLLATALLALNQFPRGEEMNSPTQKHWAAQALEEGPLVIIRNELGEWEQGWRLVLTGRGYAAVKKDGKVKWCLLKSIKPDLQNETNENCEFLSTEPDHQTSS
ncbi:PREDICTED: endogenous retrovirus group K member 25 Pol protein-like [Chaetura pelagica]|uniref:endogenous retrovirus group K member 25 Pol protein-like n=1 Tax=Chaetura pelagica TaxID=8897 RepID=UPI000523A024|nr:PREDICTED: endogenous retrovirus group K member 25 Pol protein-like [Chaetura pelagica]